MRSHVLLTATGVYPKQKKAGQKKPASRCFRCISANHATLLLSLLLFVARPVAEPLPVTISRVYLARINYSTPWPPDESSTIETFESSHSPKLFCYSFFKSISRYDYLLRHPRRRQLLHPSESQPQTKGCPRMRHLWDRRTAHNQTIPSLWWLCTSLFLPFRLER